jgi:hypothetical protein
VTRSVLLAVALALAAPALTACDGETSASLVSATVIRGKDTVRLEVPLTVYRCESSADLLLQAFQSGDGVLVWLRVRDSMPGELPIVGVRDTITRPASVVAIRYYRESQVHSFALDSGTVTIADSGQSRRVGVTGSGLEVRLGARSHVTVEMPSLPSPAESTMSCAPAR